MPWCWGRDRTGGGQRSALHKIAEDPTGFSDYVYRQSNQEETLRFRLSRLDGGDARARSMRFCPPTALFSTSLAESVRRQANGPGLVSVVDPGGSSTCIPHRGGRQLPDVINARLDADARLSKPTANGRGSVDSTDRRQHGHRRRQNCRKRRSGGSGKPGRRIRGPEPGLSSQPRDLSQASGSRPGTGS